MVSLLHIIWYLIPAASVTVWPFEPGQEAIADDVDWVELDAEVAELMVDCPPIDEDIDDVVVATEPPARIPPTYP